MSAAAALAALFFSGCGASPIAGDIRIGVTVYDEYDTTLHSVK